MNKKLNFSIALTLLLTLILSCKKGNDNSNAAAIVGSWRYTGSIVDSMSGGGSVNTTPVFDSSIGPDLGDTLRFTAADTIYYTYLGSTTWSNYSVQGNLLTLIGSTTKDVLTIHSLSPTQLQLYFQEPVVTYWIFERIAP
jgi:hypothetical protein